MKHSMKYSMKHAKHRGKWRLLEYWLSLKENTVVRMFNRLLKIVAIFDSVKAGLPIIIFTLQATVGVLQWVILILKGLYNFLSQVTSLFCCLQKGIHNVLEKLSTIWSRVKKKIIISVKGISEFT
ncbi:hypothetical protein [Levilactobacillus wangkuiensis]|uniref:hypothetical protein n=1 Tax=Levilactobacillus wangkuiensis TaxID=2799566 RepID=UPI001940CD51|nr:hypothetical protein [Levilactobacillus wangkuiensis]